jgi:hypothetical protein
LDREERKNVLALRGKRKKLVRIARMENGVVYLTEEPPGSGTYYLPLVENGKNVEEFELLKEEQLTFKGVRT